MNQASVPALPHCSECGAALAAAEQNGLCTRCLLALALALPGNATSAINLVLTGAVPLATEITPDGASRAPRFDPPTRQFGDYELLEEIARGGMGIVYKARQVSLDRTVAVKMILTGAAASKEFIHRFRTEAAAAANLQHPNIVAVHEVGAHQGENYLVMDFVEGPSLSHFVGQQPLPAPRAARYLKAIAEAIHYAHERGILHRDLKPSNVLIDSASDQPRVTDFGLAKRFNTEHRSLITEQSKAGGRSNQSSVISDQFSDLTLTGQVLGSPNFMAPEQATGAKGKMSRRTDVYGLGAILYHLLTARPPFQAESLPETLQQVANTEPLSLRLLNPSVPRDLETICLKCLEKEPEKRYATAQALAEELDRFLRDEPILARPVGRIEKGWRWCRRKPALAGSLATAALLLLVVSISSPLVALHFKRTRQVTALNLYAADIKGANVALEDHDLPGARRLLDQIATSPDQRDLRGWEWRYLMGQCRSDELATLRGHASWVLEVAFSADDQMLASIGGDGVVKLWDWRLRKEILSWQAHAAEAKYRPPAKNHALLFLPGNSTLVTSGADGFVRLWNPGSTNPLASFRNTGTDIGSLACSPDGHLLACGSNKDWRISLWDISRTEPELLARWPMPNSWVAKMVFLADGRNLVVGGRTTIRRWDISNPREPKEQSQINGSRYFAFSPAGQSLISESREPECFMRFDLSSGAGTQLAQTRGASAWTLSVSPDGRSLVSSPHNGKIVFWDLTEKHPPVTLTGHEDHIRGFAFSSDGKILASASSDQTVRLWDAAAVWRGNSRGPSVVQHGIVAHTVCFSPNSKYLASIHWEKEADQKPTSTNPSAVNQSTVKLWDVATHTEVATAPQPGPKRGGGHRVVFSPDGKSLAADDGGTLRLYTVPELEPVAHWSGSLPAFSPDGSSVVHAMTNRLVRRDLATSQEFEIGPLSDRTVALLLSPDGLTGVTSGHGGDLTFWDLPGRRLPVTVEEHQSEAWGLAFSPDGQTLASASWDMKLILWNVKERREMAVLRGHDSPLWTVAFSPDGRTLATGGYDKTVRLWNVPTRRQVAVLRGHAVNADTVAFSLDGQWLASGDGAGAVRFWRAPPFEEIAAAQQAKAEGK